MEKNGFKTILVRNGNIMKAAWTCLYRWLDTGMELRRLCPVQTKRAQNGNSMKAVWISHTVLWHGTVIIFVDLSCIVIDCSAWKRNKQQQTNHSCCLTDCCAIIDQQQEYNVPRKYNNFYAKFNSLNLYERFHLTYALQEHLIIWFDWHTRLLSS